MQSNKTVLPVSVLIPTMNRPETLQRTLNTYLSAECLPSQIVIVDQTQDAETCSAVKKIVESCSGITRCDYVYQSIPSSTKARNQAIHFSNQEFLIFSDDDVDVYSDTLENVYTIMQDKTVAMIAGIDDNTATSQTNIGYLLGTKSFKNRKIGHVTLSMLGRYPDRITGEVETQWAMGYFFAVRKSLLEKWQIAWDEKLTSYAYAEDLDFSFGYYKKAKAENLRCILSDKVYVRHLASREYRVPSRKSTYMYVLNRAYLSEKHHMGRKSRMAMSWCNFWRLVESCIRKGNAADMKRAMQVCRRHHREVAAGDLAGLYEVYK